MCHLQEKNSIILILELKTFLLGEKVEGEMVP